MNSGRVIPQPFIKKGRGGRARALAIHLLGGRWLCSYCGRRYVRCHSPALSVVVPLPANGWCCPDGHEGYIDRFLVTGDIVRERFDFLAGQRNATETN